VHRLPVVRTWRPSAFKSSDCLKPADHKTGCRSGAAHLVRTPLHSEGVRITDGAATLWAPETQGSVCNLMQNRIRKSAERKIETVYGRDQHHRKGTSLPSWLIPYLHR